MYLQGWNYLASRVGNKKYFMSKTDTGKCYKYVKKNIYFVDSLVYGFLSGMKL